jgi:NADH:ubiquinone oxidoreductase subunit 6 (subunit J)
MLTRGAGMADAPLTNRWPIAVAICLLLFGLLSALLVSVPWPNTVSPITQDTVAALGDALLNQYLMPFEIASILLLAALIGAAFVARGK